MSLSTRTVRFTEMRGRAIISVLMKAAAAGSALILQWLIARLFGPTGSGYFALMATTVTFIGITAGWGQDYIALRNIAGDLAEGNQALAHSQARASLRIAAIGAAVGTAAVVVLALVYGSLTPQPAMMGILLLASPVCAGIAVGRVLSFVARASGSVIASQLPDGPINSGVALTLMGLLVVSGLAIPVWALGLVYGAAYLAALAFSVLLYRKTVRGWPHGPAVPLAPLMSAGFPLVLTNAVPYLTDWAVIFVATAVFSPATAGLIRIVTLFLSVMYLVTIALDAVIAPPMAAAVRTGDYQKLSRLYRQYVAGSVLLNLPLIAAAWLVPGLILSLFGEQFVNAAPALRLGVTIQLLTIALGPAGMVLVMVKRERLIILVNLAGLLVLGISCAVLIPLFGVIGGVAASAATLLTKRAVEVALMLVKEPAIRPYRP